MHWCVSRCLDWAVVWYVCVVSFRKSGAIDDIWCVSVSTFLHSIIFGLVVMGFQAMWEIPEHHKREVCAWSRDPGLYGLAGTQAQARILQWTGFLLAKIYIWWKCCAFFLRVGWLDGVLNICALGTSQPGRELDCGSVDLTFNMYLFVIV